MMTGMRRPVQGFTLVEVLVAVSLLALLLGLLFGAMRTGMRSWQVAETRIAAAESTLQVERFLVRTISQARPPRGMEGGVPQVGGGSFQGEGSVLEGTSGSILFVAPGVNALPRPGLYRYEIFIEERGGTEPVRDLWVRMAPYRGVDTEAGEARLLQEGLAAFELRYFGALQQGEEPAWVDEWPPTAGRAPLLVAIRLQPAKAAVRPWLMVAPMVTSVNT